MNHLDVLYRALTDYKKQTEEDRVCKQLRKAIALANAESDKIDAVLTDCTVEEDWIIAIEKGLSFIEKAINEGRQHIETKGEVVPIETVKRVSKDSVKHLSKHSELISKEQNADHLIPEKLYIVERLSDFAVYENRFLYMLLSYLKNFISSKYSKILELSNTYKFSLSMNKTLSVNKRKLVFQLNMTDEKQDDAYIMENNSLNPILKRIDNLLKTVMHLLSTPLIQEVSKVPMLKPPITKTNVLKVNQNFKGAVTLYDFITAYTKLGYTVNTREQKICPFPDDTANEYAEVVLLTTFLTYKNTLGLKKYFKTAYEAEEKRRKEAEEQNLKERLLQLRNRIDEAGCNPMEYLLLLENWNKSLEEDSLLLKKARSEIDKLSAETSELKNTVQILSTTVEEKQVEIAFLNQKYAEEKANLLDEHKQEIDELNDNYTDEIAELNEQHESALEEMKAEQEQTLTEKNTLIAELDLKLSEQQSIFAQQIQEIENTSAQKIHDLQAEHGAEKAKLEELNAIKNEECEQLIQAKALSDSRVYALRKEYNLIAPNEDFTAKATFDELEHQFKVFKAFFKDEWKKTKKNIRKEVFIGNPKNENSDGNVNKDV